MKREITLNEKLYLTLEEAAARCNLGRNTLRPYVDSGEIPSAWFNSRRLIYRPGLDAWAERRTQQISTLRGRRTA